MKAQIPTAFPARARQMVLAAVFLAGFGFGLAGTANAEPGEWDIDAYDKCMAKTARSPEGCCLTTGGVLTPGPDGPICGAPPAAQQDQPSGQVTTVQPTNTFNLPTLPRQPAAVG